MFKLFYNILYKIILYTSGLIVREHTSMTSIDDVIWVVIYTLINSMEPLDET